MACDGPQRWAQCFTCAHCESFTPVFNDDSPGLLLLMPGTCAQLQDPALRLRANRAWSEYGDPTFCGQECDVTWLCAGCRGRGWVLPFRCKA